MRYLGLDLGTKTLGVAISDATKTIATSLGTIRFDECDYDKAIVKLKVLVKDFSVEKIVLGFPKNMNNTVGESGERTLKFKEMLEKEFNIPVIMQDERLSTVEATNYMLEANASRRMRKVKIDSVAATIILQTFLDKEKGR